MLRFIVTSGLDPACHPCAGHENPQIDISGMDPRLRGGDILDQEINAR